MEFILRVSCELSPHQRDEQCKQTYALYCGEEAISGQWLVTKRYLV